MVHDNNFLITISFKVTSNGFKNIFSVYAEHIGRHYDLIISLPKLYSFILISSTGIAKI
jgi:hypothetical protein